MRKIALSIGKVVYHVTPFKYLQNIYIKLFYQFVKDKKIITSINGLNYELDLSEIIDCGIYLGSYEKDVVRAIDRVCKFGSTVIDIGANIGAHALSIANIIGENGSLCAFEPTEYAYNKLTKNISLNGFKNIQASRIALSNVNSKRKKISYRSSWKTDGSSADSSCLVDFVRLDDWCNDNQIGCIDLIKLDVDGNEYAVIDGAREVLSKFKPIIIMEVWGPNFGDDSRNPFLLLKEIGYNFFDIESNNEFKDIDELMAPVINKRGELLDYSYNVIAQCR